MIIALVAAVLDNLYLYKLSSVFPFNSLKISNQVYSVICFFYLNAFLTKPILPKYFNPRLETVGIYFVHQVVVFFANFLKKLVLLIIGIRGRNDIPVDYLFISAFFTLIFVYITSLIIVKLIIKTKYAKWIGIPIVKQLKKEQLSSVT